MECGGVRDRLVQTMVRSDMREFQRILSEIEDLTSVRDSENATCKD